MATATRSETKAQQLTDEQLVEMMELLPDVDSVELKLTIPETHQQVTTRALDVDPLDAQIRQIYFFDTPDLLLERNGMAVRARRIQGKPSDSTVKLRPVVPHELPKKVRRSPNMVVEVDAMPGGYVCSASMKNNLGLLDIRPVATGQLPIRKLFSKEQRAFFEAFAPEGMGLDDLSVLGPIFVLKLKFAPTDFNRKIAAELWIYPDASSVLELSTRTVPTDAFQARAEARAFLTKRGLSMTGEQRTKTKTALQFFSKELQAASQPAATAERSARQQSSTSSSGGRRRPAAT
jgi:hypothetical protein